MDFTVGGPVPAPVDPEVGVRPLDFTVGGSVRPTLDLSGGVGVGVSTHALGHHQSQGVVWRARGGLAVALPPPSESPALYRPLLGGALGGDP